MSDNSNHSDEEPIISKSFGETLDVLNKLNTLANEVEVYDDDTKSGTVPVQQANKSLDELYEERQQLLRELGLSNDDDSVFPQKQLENELAHLNESPPFDYNNLEPLSSTPTSLNKTFDVCTPVVQSCSTPSQKRRCPFEYLAEIGTGEQDAIDGAAKAFKLDQCQEQGAQNSQNSSKEASHLSTPSCNSVDVGPDTQLMDCSNLDLNAPPVENRSIEIPENDHFAVLPAENGRRLADELFSGSNDDDDDDEEAVEENIDEEAYDLLEKNYGAFFKKEEQQRQIGGKGDKLKEGEFAGCSIPPLIRNKIVLKRKGTEYFEVLPEGWIEVSHSSGLPIYLHKASRVCTLSRPYFLGPGSLRNHNVPVSAIPCLHQKRLKELEDAREREKQLEEERFNNNRADPLAILKRPATDVQTIEDFKRCNLTSLQLREYCQKSFDFQTIQVLRFKSWTDHRSFYSKKKRRAQMATENGFSLPSNSALLLASNRLKQHYLKQRLERGKKGIFGRPHLPTNVKLITVPDLEKNFKAQRRQFFLNPQGKTNIAILHEYVQKVLKGNVTYEFSETRNAANPYTAKVKVMSGGGGDDAASTTDWVVVGSGAGNSKKKAKSAAAKDALRILVPGLALDGVADAASRGSSRRAPDKRGIASTINGATTAADESSRIVGDDEGGGGDDDDDDYRNINEDDNDYDATNLFDSIKVTDARVYELSIKAGQPAPFIVLQECLKRNSAFGDTTIDMKIERVRHQKHEFTMRVGGGKHEVKVMCSNKREGKQKAAQLMLQKLQPQVNSWGELVRLYGYGAQLKLQQDRHQKDSVIRLQTQQQQLNNQHKQNSSKGGPLAHPNNPLEPNMAILAKLRQEMRKLLDKPTNQAPNLGEPLRKGSVKTINI